MVVMPLFGGAYNPRHWRSPAGQRCRKLVLDLDHITIDAPCPVCGYCLEIAMVDVRTQVWRWCPCCRTRIRFIEPDGTVSGSIDTVDRAMRDLTRQLKAFSG